MTPEFPYVLLADDDPDDRDFFCFGMKRLYPHITVQTFMDGDQLLEYLKHCSATALPRCILLDYKMPRLTAPQFLQAAATSYKQVPTIVWSTSHLTRDMEECLSLGAAEFFIKPGTDAELDNLLRSLGQWLAPGSGHSLGKALCASAK